eukprot:COSAG05_NODE_13605_length_423_cov_7.604938_1_plen_64_part_00
MVGTEAVVVIIVVVYSFFGDGVIAIAGPRVVCSRYNGSVRRRRQDDAEHRNKERNGEKTIGRY